jgi:protein-L-isoaspartate(D-aspartate) O-methyltransferase
MLELLGLKPRQKVLEVGLGSGYSAALLAEVAGEVWSIERNPQLAAEARARLKEMGYDKIHIRVGDGTLGWPGEAPFDAILVEAGSPSVPQTLLGQLKPKGRILIPVGNQFGQMLLRVTKTLSGGAEEERLFAVRFVPLIGAEGWKEASG